MPEPVDAALTHERAAHRPRIPPGRLSELGVVNWVVSKVLSRAAGVREAHLFTTLGRQRRLFRAWLRFSARLMPGGKISRRETELVILRVAHLRQCAYEQDHHERIAQRIGLTADQVQRVQHGPHAEGWNYRQRALLLAVDELVAHKAIDDATWSQLEVHYAPAQLIELCLLVGQYEMLATTISVLRIARDAPIAPTRA